MFRLINVSPKHIFLSGKDRSSASQSFSLPHIMFRLISVSPIHMFQSLPHMMFRLVNIPAYYIVYLSRETNLIEFLDILHF